MPLVCINKAIWLQQYEGFRIIQLGNLLVLGREREMSLL